jgi:hypothetical protein
VNAGPVDDFELRQLQGEAFARGWALTRHGDGKVTASREDGSASVTVQSAKQMRVVLHNAMWDSLTARNPNLPPERM